MKVKKQNLKETSCMLQTSGV